MTARTVRVRVAVAVDSKGRWRAVGGRPGNEEAMLARAARPLHGHHSRFWLTATLPIPEAAEVEATVEEAT